MVLIRSFPQGCSQDVDMVSSHLKDQLGEVPPVSSLPRLLAVLGGSTFRLTSMGLSTGLPHQSPSRANNPKDGEREWQGQSHGLFVISSQE